jgi:hypothetical protein
MTDTIPNCPVCKTKLIADSRYLLGPPEDMYMCDTSYHSFVYFKSTNRFGLVIEINKDQIIASIDLISINKNNFHVPENYCVNNCYEILMSLYEKYNSNRAFS